MLYVYDAQYDKLHEIADQHPHDLREYGYQGNTGKALSCLCYSMLGLDSWPTKEAAEALETRLFYQKKLLVNRNTVHDIRTSLGGVLLLPQVDRLVMFAKIRVNFMGRLHDYRFVLSNQPFDNPAQGSLDSL